MLSINGVPNKLTLRSNARASEFQTPSPMSPTLPPTMTHAEYAELQASPATPEVAAPPPPKKSTKPRTPKKKKK